MKNILKSVVVVLILACTIELVIFNFSFVKDKFTNESESNLKYTKDKLEFVNWTKDEEHYISNIDSYIILKDLDVDVDNLKIVYNTNKVVSNVDVFYTITEDEKFDQNQMFSVISENKGTIIINANSYIKNLRIDLRDETKVELYDILLVVNEMKLNFSISRIIAMLSIYCLANLLSLIQKSPEYNIENMKI